jgi:hypothetical protein
MNLNAQRISLWLSVVFGAVLLVAFVLFPGFFPPMSPDMSAPQVADFYAHNTTMIRTSMIIFNLCGVMLLPLFMVIVHQIKRMATPIQVFGVLLPLCRGERLHAVRSGRSLLAHRRLPA